MSLHPKLANKSIMIVDDQVTLRSLIKASLSSHGFENLMEASDGEKASKLLASKKVDLVISDWEMPNMDGLTLFNTLQNQESQKDIPFILLTKHDSKEKVTKAIKSGIKNYIVKPFTPGAIINKVVDILQ